MANLTNEFSMYGEYQSATAAVAHDNELFLESEINIYVKSTHETQIESPCVQ
jgi:hypothetical protein